MNIDGSCNNSSSPAGATPSISTVTKKTLNIVRFASPTSSILIIPPISPASPPYNHGCKESVSLENGLHSTNSASILDFPIDQPTADMNYSISAFIQSLALGEPGKCLLAHIRYICECFGFPMFFCLSKYIARDEPESARVLKNARLEFRALRPRVAGRRQSDAHSDA